MERECYISPDAWTVLFNASNILMASADATLEEVDLVNGSWED